MNIPSLLQSSVDPEKVSLTVSSIGKTGAFIITFLGVVNVVDPVIAGQVWSGWVESIITAIPAGFAVYHATQALFGIFRKVGMRLLGLVYTAPVPAQQ